MSALGNGEEIFDEIRAVEELRMVGRDTVVLCGPLQSERTYGETVVASEAKCAEAKKDVSLRVGKAGEKRDL